MLKPSLCCISINLANQGHKFQTTTRKKYLSLEQSEAFNLILNKTISNLKVIKLHIEYCLANGWNYRIGSGAIPLATLPEFMEVDGVNRVFSNVEVQSLCQQIRQLISDTKIRCSMHPDQFVVPASANPSTVAKSVNDLVYHAHFMDIIGLPQDHNAPINIHMNCYKGDRAEIFNRFMRVYEKLPFNVQSRLTLENEDKGNSWSVNKLTTAFRNMGIPITYDNLHHKCNPDGLSGSEAMSLCEMTWPTGVRPLFHFSGGDKKNPRAHSDYVTEVPSEYLLSDKFIDFDFEFKMKDLAITKYQNETI